MRSSNPWPRCKVLIFKVTKKRKKDGSNPLSTTKSVGRTSCTVFFVYVVVRSPFPIPIQAAPIRLRAPTPECQSPVYFSPVPCQAAGLDILALGRIPGRVYDRMSLYRYFPRLSLPGVFALHVRSHVCLPRTPAMKVLPGL